MFAKSRTQNISNENTIFDFLKGLIVATLLSFALIILSAFSLKWFSLPDSAISPITLSVKAVSTLIGSLIAIKGSSKGLLKGVLFGIIYVAVAFVVFSILAGSFTLSLNTLLDLGFCAVIGGIIGIIKVNKK